MLKAIKCGSFFSAADDKVQKDVVIIVDGNKITEIVPGAKFANPGSYEVIDLSAKFVMPGLIDTHMHMAFNGEANLAFGARKHGDATLHSMLNLQKDLLAGFTTIRDEGAQGFVDVSVRDAINSGLIWGPRALVSGIGLSGRGGHGDFHYAPHIKPSTSDTSNIVCGADSAREAARYVIKYGADQIKLMATGGVMSEGDAPGAQELTFEEMRAAIEIAEFNGKLSSAHAHGHNGVTAAAKAGITSIEHGMILDDEAIDAMKKHGTYLVPTIIAAKNIVDNGIKAGIPVHAVEKAALVLETHKAGFQKCIKAGIKIAFGTDAATPFNRHGEQAVEFENMVNYGLKPIESIIAGTRTAAQLMRMDKMVGTLEVGKYADITAFNENPIENIKTLTNCVFVMKDGKVYKS